MLNLNTFHVTCVSFLIIFVYIQDGMLHITFVLWIVKILFLKNELVFQRRIYALNYFIRILGYCLGQSGKYVLVAINTLNN